VARRLVFLPGVSGSGDFWSPVAELLAEQGPAREPTTPAWAYEPVGDRTAAIERLDLPVLLIWASHGPTSPVGIGEAL
jgi:pimeloyl-ACP methyl ester carboxylesterase